MGLSVHRPSQECIRPAFPLAQQPAHSPTRRTYRHHEAVSPRLANLAENVYINPGIHPFSEGTFYSIILLSLTPRITPKSTESKSLLYTLLLAPSPTSNHGQGCCTPRHSWPRRHGRRRRDRASRGANIRLLAPQPVPPWYVPTSATYPPTLPIPLTGHFGLTTKSLNHRGRGQTPLPLQQGPQRMLLVSQNHRDTRRCVSPFVLSP